MTRAIIAHGERHRDVAAEWHDGQWSPLYAYASSGAIVDGLTTDIIADIRSCLAHDDNTEPDTYQAGRLLDLLDHVVDQIIDAWESETDR